jgi:hypothetical protein
MAYAKTRDQPTEFGRGAGDVDIPKLEAQMQPPRRRTAAAKVGIEVMLTASCNGCDETVHLGSCARSPEG